MGGGGWCCCCRNQLPCPTCRHATMPPCQPARQPRQPRQPRPAAQPAQTTSQPTPPTPPLPPCHLPPRGGELFLSTQMAKNMGPRSRSPLGEPLWSTLSAGNQCGRPKKRGHTSVDTILLLGWKPVGDTNKSGVSSGLPKELPSVVWSRKPVRASEKTWYQAYACHFALGLETNAG